jgi:hypothetical protein
MRVIPGWLSVPNSADDGKPNFHGLAVSSGRNRNLRIPLNVQLCCRQLLEVGAGVYQRSAKSAITGRAASGQQRATQPATQRSSPSPRAPFALFHTKRGERVGVRDAVAMGSSPYCLHLICFYIACARESAAGNARQKDAIVNNMDLTPLALRTGGANPSPLQGWEPWVWGFGPGACAARLSSDVPAGTVANSRVVNAREWLRQPAQREMAAGTQAQLQDRRNAHGRLGSPRSFFLVASMAGN